MSAGFFQNDNDLKTTTSVLRLEKKLLYPEYLVTHTPLGTVLHVPKYKL